MAAFPDRGVGGEWHGEPDWTTSKGTTIRNPPKPKELTEEEFMNMRFTDYIQTDMKSPELAEWLRALMGRLHDAAVTAGAKDEAAVLYQYIDALSQTLKAFGEHRGDGDPLKRTSRDGLLRSIKIHLGNFRDCLWMRSAPSSPATGVLYNTTIQWEQRTNEIIEKKQWCNKCNYCGGCSRDAERVDSEKGKYYCTLCLPRVACKCAECAKWASRDAVRTIQSQDGGRKTRTVCRNCTPADAFPCSRCSNLYFGQINAAKGLSMEETKKRGWNLCKHCSESICNCKCGHIDLTGHEVEAPYDNVEDATDDGRARQPVIIMCESCANRADRDTKPKFWEAHGELTGRVFDDLKSRRRYGVEIEVCYAPAASDLPNAIAKHWHAKHDGSLPPCGVEFASVPMSGDEGLAAISSLLEYAGEHGWAVNGRAGLHLHLDMTGLGAEQKAGVGLAYLQTQKLWSCWVAPPRVNGTFSTKHPFSRESLQKALDQTPDAFITSLKAGGGNARYKWVNWNALDKHGTIEVRSHQGTLDYEKVSHWIKAHTRFVDWCADQGSREAVNRVFNQDKLRESTRNSFLFMVQNIWKDRSMGRWFRKRGEKFAFKEQSNQVLPPTARKLRLAGVSPDEEV